MIAYRTITLQEQNQLISNGCTSLNWNLITVKDGFTAENIYLTEFIGNVQLGNFKMGSGLRNTTLQDCIIEDNVTIKQVGLISNYIVRSNAIIKYCSTIKASDKATYGQGTKVETVNEAGGREVILFNKLTAQTAYLMAFMQHNLLFINSLNKLIYTEIQNNTSEKGIIGHHAQITSTTTIEDIIVDDYAIIEGASMLKNGTILSSQSAPTAIGHGVMAYNFIASYGSIVNNGSILKNCYVGEGTVIDRQFSAENSLFFANSQMYHGEACAVFAAPYSVSHHKSTLLIANYCGFLNVGSGSNQSNHMYKLGPVHQGILERGCKLGSDAYILWPAKIGAFTFITGRHYSNPNTSDFPFSYLLDDNGISQLVPAANLRSVGTLRDSSKWPQRDMRKGPKNDIIHFQLLNPYTIASVSRGIASLKQIESTQKAENGYYTVGDVRIKKPALKRGLEVYNEIVKIYFGNLIVEKIIAQQSSNIQLSTTNNTLNDNWLDLAGMIINQNDLDRLVNDVIDNSIDGIGKLQKRLKQLGDDLVNLEWTWLMSKSSDFIDIDITSIKSDDLLKFLDIYGSNADKFYQMLLKDAQKEFSDRSKTGYGINLSDEIIKLDFESVRGNFSSNSFVEYINQQINNVAQNVEEVKKIIS